MELTAPCAGAHTHRKKMLPHSNNKDMKPPGCILPESARLDISSASDREDCLPRANPILSDSDIDLEVASHMVEFGTSLFVTDWKEHGGAFLSIP